MNYKFKYSLAIHICAFICWLVPNIIWASVEVDGIYYDLNTTAKTATVASNPNKYTGTVAIPSNFVYNGNTYSVMSIGSTAFQDCSGLMDISMPNSVTSIAPSAFERCTGLTTLYIGRGVATIDYEAFKNCSNLTALILPASVNLIGNESFSGCSSLAEIIAERTTAPTIASTTFNGVDKSSCTVYVPEGCRSAYANASYWKTFSDIVERIVVDTGSCGDNVTYTIYSDMTMVISGTGEMKDLIHTGLHINDDYYQNITRTIIEEGVTSVGENTFNGCSALASLMIPNGVTSIGPAAFEHCISLLSVVIPNSVTYIGYMAFYDCTGLISINIPKVSSLSFAVFGSCIGLTSVEIPYGVLTIGNSAFSGCSGLTSVTIPNSVTSIEDRGFLGCENLTTMKMPNSVTEIGGYVFAGCTSLTDVTISDNVFSINDGVFYGCTGMTSVTIPNSVTSIGGSAFNGCTGLTSVTIGNSVTSIDSYAFSGCTGLTSIIVESETPAVVGEYAFYEVNKTSCTLFVPAGSKSAYENAEGWSDFQNIVEALATGYCGDNVTYTIYSDMSMVISGTGAMTDFALNYDYDYNVVIRENNELWTGVENVTIEEGVTSIGDWAFHGCTNLASVTIPNSVTGIGESAFEGCTSLASVTFPNSMTSIGDGAFYGCTGLTSMTIPNSVTSIGCVTFHGCTGLTSVTIGNSVASIGISAFSVCTGLASVTIPNSVTSIGESAFLGCTTLASITVDAGNTIYDSRNDCNAIIETATNTLITGCKNTVIPNSVTSIGESAFSGCTGLTSVTIPSSVTSIGESAFRSCTGLTTVTIPNSIMSIGDHAFQQCTGLTSVSIPSSVTSIGYSAFSECLGLTSIIVEGETPASIEYNTYYAVDKTNCTLYVPLGSKSAYENANYWRDFENIVEYDPEPDTDISTLDNAIYVEQTEGRIGGTKDIKVKMKNDFDVRGFQFTMELPEGATIHSWTLNQGRMPAGTTMNKVFATEGIDENKINVVCALNDGEKTFTGNDGLIATVNVSFVEDMEEGTYPIYLTDISISDATAEYQLELSDIKSTLVLEDYVVGDTNGDGKVLVGDVIAILNYIVGSPSNNFNAKAADVNGDGKILVGDVIAVLNIIVNQ